jgi:hypothetical protein
MCGTDSANGAAAANGKNGNSNGNNGNVRLALSLKGSSD